MQFIVQSLLRQNQSIMNNISLREFIFQSQIRKFHLDAIKFRKTSRFLSLVSHRFASFTRSSTVSAGRYRATVIRLDLLTKTLQLVGGGSRTRGESPRTIDGLYLKIS